MGRLDGKVALVTGAARGTGAAIAKRFVAEGARVVIADILDERGNDTAARLGDAARFRHHDVTSEEDWASATDELRVTEGRLDVLVNDAAVLHLSAIDDTSRETFETVFRVNCLGPFLGIRACLPLLRDVQGSIVNIGSINSLFALPGTVAYTAAKFGLRGLTMATALENKKYGVRCNIVCPAGGNLEMHTSLVGGPGMDHPPSEDEQRAAGIPQTGPDLAKIASVALFLASDDAEFCSGSEFLADHGMRAGTVIDIPGVWSSTL
jgi:3alpha(or 20beta)-hydroxysteroid dehydrogenase